MPPQIETSTGRPWWQDAVFYQIYPRSFADGNGDGVGDLRGIVARIDYVRDLGVDAIWISPFFRSPMADFGYDICDHTDVDPLFGSRADAEWLITTAHDAGLRVIFDIVLGHTSDQHDWFLDSASSRDATKRDWYVWRDGPTPGRPDGGPPNNWQAGFPPGASSWTWHPPSRQWYLHSHLPQQPDLDWTNPAVRAAQADVLRFWLDRGIDGVRLDSINRLGKDPKLRDNVEGQPLRQQDWPDLHDYLREVRHVVDVYPGVMIVGEVWEFEQRNLMPYLAADELHLAHNFVFARLPFDATAFRTTVQEFTALAEQRVWPAWFLNNHDEPRVVSRWAGDDGPDVAAARARLGATMLLTLRGTPFLYQGEELGLPDTALPDGVGTDRNGRDPQRTPIPWRAPSLAGPGAGFTTGTPWLPVGDDAERLNVSAQAADPTSMLGHYRALLRLRAASPALRHGEQELLDLPAGLFGYARTSDQQTLAVVLNFRTEERTVELTALTPGSTAPTLLHSSRPEVEQEHVVGDGTISLLPLHAVILDLTVVSQAGCARDGAR